ncbi:aldehyde dehydrogenase family protein [Actinokineospora auranticolor]|uniref:Acyl-CoA reductase-like NAD-dependent aldehyde dehydrogenase n=1 Tax=Actinokineospora auranticolor TaxID=155976 RepID=A0A2S6GMH4_9PSEU|nr:aldehyde dehydrogenase family protein [Actinokineospora auranticolor]PPK66442.1 acyl-CoA reductase-like NAD-dependent aldehyde dehydrogenase [Actinokineospora auranticolor]
MSTPYWVAGKPRTSDSPVTVRSPFDATVAGVTSNATAADIEEAVAAAAAARDEVASAPAHVRADALDHVSRRLGERLDEVAALITAESGKPISWARVEVTRAIATFRWGAEEARRFSGSVQRLDTDPGSEDRVALVRQVPRGPVLGITPFNFPVNLVAHKLAPAIAAGCPVIIKPAPATPLSALLLGELLAETDLPTGAWSVLPMTNEQIAEMVGDPRLPVISFTGSDAVGFRINDANPRKHVLLELGGNAPVLICPDWSDIEGAAARVATFGTHQAGQSCVSVQRVFVHTDVYDRFVPALVSHVRGLANGDPADPNTHVGPMINADAARRVSDWVADAVTRGATLLAGGGGTGTLLDPVVLADVPPTCAVVTEEVFGPVIVVQRVESVDAAITAANTSRYGLQAGVFTHDLRLAAHATAKLQVGGVVIGDVPTYRADQMPYGGIKDSGVGREGVLSAMLDLTEPKVMVLTEFVS